MSVSRRKRYAAVRPAGPAPIMIAVLLFSVFIENDNLAFLLMFAAYRRRV